MLINFYLMSTDGLLINVSMIDLCDGDLDDVFDVFDDETSSSENSLFFGVGCTAVRSCSSTSFGPFVEFNM
jgi:hypothetical protein